MNSKPQRVSLTDIADEVLSGLSSVPKSLSPRLFYDDAGSELFEQITQLPEYYLTRIERNILTRHAEEMITVSNTPATIIELGAGSASKTTLLLRAALANRDNVTFYPIDVSGAALADAAERLRTELPRLQVRPVELDYTSAMKTLRQIPGRKLVLYIGSSIGNFQPLQAVGILSQLRRTLNTGDCLLLGTDMRKRVPVLLAAYNDSQGVTESFNKNVLARINRELGGHFELDTFAHRVVWNADESRIEMHLESLVSQTVAVDDLDAEFQFAAGERIHTENSYKFSIAMVDSLATNSGFTVERTWSDSRAWFTVHLLRA